MYKYCFLIIASILFISCMAGSNKENNNLKIGSENISPQNLKNVENIIFTSENELLGTVWTGKTNVKDNETGELILKNIAFTFVEDNKIQVLEYENFTSTSYGSYYSYEKFDGGINIYVYRDEIDINNEYNMILKYRQEKGEKIDENEIWSTIPVHKDYIAVITDETMTFSKWLNGENLVLSRRKDLGKNENAIKIIDTYYENFKYFVILECKKMEYHGDISLWISVNEEGKSIGVNRMEGGYYDLATGYNRVIISFTEDEIKEKEEKLLIDAIFAFTGTGSFTEEDKQRYLRQNTPPSYSYIWASIGSSTISIMAKTEGRIKFR